MHFGVATSAVAGLISATKISVIVFLLLGFSCYRKLWPLFRCYFCSMPLYDYTQYTKMASKSLISTQILFPKKIFRYENFLNLYDFRFSKVLEFQLSTFKILRLSRFLDFWNSKIFKHFNLCSRLQCFGDFKTRLFIVTFKQFGRAKVWKLSCATSKGKRTRDSETERGS